MRFCLLLVVCMWHKIKSMAIKPEANDLRENLPLDIENASRKPQALVT